MTPEEYLQLKALMQQNQRHLLTNQQHLKHLVEHADRNRWYSSFGSDVAANILTSAGFWLLKKLLAKR